MYLVPERVLQRVNGAASRGSLAYNCGCPFTPHVPELNKMYKVVLMMALSSTGADLPIPYSGPGSCWGGPGCYGWSNCFAGRACSGSIGFSAFNRGSGGSGGYACQGSTGSYSNVGPVVEKETLSPKTKPAHTSPVEELHAPKEAASARQATIVVSLPPVRQTDLRRPANRAKLGDAPVYNATARSGQKLAISFTGGNGGRRLATNIDRTNRRTAGPGSACPGRFHKKRDRTGSLKGRTLLASILQVIVLAI